MAHWDSDQPHSSCISDSDEYNIGTPTTTSENVTVELEQDPDLRNWVPSHGSTIIIRSISCGNVITLLDGHIVLAPLGSRGSIYWTCVESQGWVGFRNTVSGKFLNHGEDGKLECSAKQDHGWRKFTITPVPKGGYIMQMLDWWDLRPIVRTVEKGLPKMGRTGNKLSEGILWEFIKVE